MSITLNQMNQEVEMMVTRGEGPAVVLICLPSLQNSMKNYLNNFDLHIMYIRDKFEECRNEKAKLYLPPAYGITHRML